LSVNEKFIVFTQTYKDYPSNPIEKKKQQRANQKLVDLSNKSYILVLIVAVVDMIGTGTYTTGICPCVLVYILGLG